MALKGQYSTYFQTASMSAPPSATAQAGKVIPKAALAPNINGSQTANSTNHAIGSRGDDRGGSMSKHSCHRAFNELSSTLKRFA